MKATLKNERGKYFSVELDGDVYKLYHDLRDNGLNMPPHRIPIKFGTATLVAENELEQNMIRLFRETDSLDDVVELDKSEFENFSKALLSDYDFLIENRDSMFVDELGVTHALLVIGEGHEDGILVDSEGSSYARYSALLPNARTFLLSHEQTVNHERYKDLCGRLVCVLGESEAGEELYDTLRNEVGMSDDEIAAVGFSSLGEYFSDEEYDEPDESPTLTM